MHEEYWPSLIKKESILNESEGQGVYQTILFKHYKNTLENIFKRSLNLYFKSSFEDLLREFIVKHPSTNKDLDFISIFFLDFLAKKELFHHESMLCDMRYELSSYWVVKNKFTQDKTLTEFKKSLSHGLFLNKTIILDVFNFRPFKEEKKQEECYFVFYRRLSDLSIERKAIKRGYFLLLKNLMEYKGENLNLFFQSKPKAMEKLDFLKKEEVVLGL